MSLLGVDAGADQPPCDCGAFPHEMHCARVVAAVVAQTGCEGAGPHSVHCHCVAARTPNAMTDEQGQVFYPDSLEDARYFARNYGARPLHPDKFAEFLGGPL